MEVTFYVRRQRAKSISVVPIIRSPRACLNYFLFLIGRTVKVLGYVVPVGVESRERRGGRAA